MTPLFPSDSLHYAKLTLGPQAPELTGEAAHLAGWALKNLEGRFPGLKVVRSLVGAREVRLLLDFNRLDEDLLRVLQSYKSEVRNLLKKKGFSGEHLWQWNYEECWVATPEDLARVEPFLVT